MLESLTWPASQPGHWRVAGYGIESEKPNKCSPLLWYEVISSEWGISFPNFVWLHLLTLFVGSVLHLHPQPPRPLPQVKPNLKQEMLFHIFKWHINNRSMHSLYAWLQFFFKAWKRNQYKQVLVGERGKMHFLWGEEFLIISLSAGFQLARFSAAGRFSNQQFSWGQLPFETDQPVCISLWGPSSHPDLCFLPWEHSRPPSPSIQIPAQGFHLDLESVLIQFMDWPTSVNPLGLVPCYFIIHFRA